MYESPAFVIPDEQANYFEEHWGTLDEDARALYKVWCFHKKPSQKMVISISKCREYAVIDTGDRVGRLDMDTPTKDALYVFGDNDLTYYGKLIDRERKLYRVIANLGDWKRKLESLDRETSG